VGASIISGSARLRCWSSAATSTRSIWSCGRRTARGIRQSRALARQCYTLLHWRHAGMEQWLVFDFNADALTAFNRILRYP
jgi:hypothetical protein